MSHTQGNKNGKKKDTLHITKIAEEKTSPVGGKKFAARFHRSEKNTPARAAGNPEKKKPRAMGSGRTWQEDSDWDGGAEKGGDS